MRVILAGVALSAAAGMGCPGATFVVLPGQTTSPPVIPDPVRTFIAYTPDGNFDIPNGIGGILFRPQIIDAMPRLKAVGFGRYITPIYLGIARSDADAESYFAPLVAAAEANEMRFVPGVWLYHFVHVIHGRADMPPWNVTLPDWDVQHPLNPTAYNEAAVWNEFVERVTIVGRAAHTTQVYVDCEDVFYRHRHHSFFTDEVLANMRGMIRNAVETLRARGILLSVYHPQVHRTDPAIQRIAIALFRPDSPDDALSQVEHLVPDPFFDYSQGTPTDIDEPYLANGFTLGQLSYGFLSNHAGSDGFSPQEYVDWVAQFPGIEQRTWFSTSHFNLQNAIAGFEAIDGG